MTNKILWLFLGLIISCKQTKTPKTKQKTEPEKQMGKAIKVKIALAKDTVFYKQILSNGRVQSPRMAQLHFNQNGYLKKIYIKNGAYVRQGMPVASLENNLWKVNLQKAQIAVAKARQKYEALQIEYNQKEKTALQVQSGLSEAKALLKEAQIKYNQSVLKAPFSGQIANLNNQTGNLITPADTIATLLDTRYHEVVFSVPESDFALLHKGDPIQVASFYNPDATYAGVLTNINPMVNAYGLVNLRGKITDHPTDLINGMRVKVFINKPMNNMIVIPKTAVVLRNNKEVVFTYHKGLAVWHYIKISGENKDSYAISSGLKDGDSIIISNNINLAHDAYVKIAK